jgi:osmotically-inducible protein OsmY
MRSGLGWLAAAALATTVAACGPREPDYEQTADEALEGAALDAVDANYDNDARTIHLTGTVQNETDRQRAGDVVAKAVGDGAQIANEVTVAGAHEETADDFDGSLENRLDEAVDAEADLKDRNVDFAVNNGVVTISGSVASATERDKVGELARSQPGVRDVINSLKIEPAPRR